MCGLSALTFVRNRVEDIVRMAFMMCKVSRGHDGNLIATQPILCVHKRKYDETQIPCVVDMPMGDDTGTVTTCSGKHRILVLEGGFGMILRRAAAASGPEFCKIMGGLPCHLQAIERNNGECLAKSFEVSALGKEVEGMIDSRFHRVVDLHIHDECSANLRAERFLHLQRSDNSHSKASLGLLCDAHKKAQVTGTVLLTVKPIDSKLVRLALSLRTVGRHKIRKEMREISRKKLVIHYGASPPVSSDLHRQQVWDTFVGDGTACDKYRRKVLSMLFNGDLRRRDRIDHYENGCCADPAQTMRMFETVGLTCLLPRLEFRLLQRNNWTGSDTAIDDFALPSQVHGLFEQAFLRSSLQTFVDAGLALPFALPGAHDISHPNQPTPLGNAFRTAMHALDAGHFCKPPLKLRMSELGFDGGPMSGPTPLPVL